MLTVLLIAATTAMADDGWVAVHGPWHPAPITALAVDSDGGPVVIAAGRRWVRGEEGFVSGAVIVAQDTPHLLSVDGTELWFSGGDGLCVRSGTSARCFSTNSGTLVPLAIPSDADGWASGRAGQAFVIADGTASRVFSPHLPIRATAQLLSATPIADDEVWLATNTALLRWTGTVAPAPSGPVPTPIATTRVCARGDARVVAGPDAWELRGEAWHHVADGVRTCASDPDGDVWLAMTGGGLQRWDGRALSPAPVGTHRQVERLAFRDDAGWAAAGATLLRRDAVQPTYVDVTARTGVENRGDPIAALMLDADGDSDPDLLVVNETGGPRLWRGTGGGALADATLGSGLEGRRWEAPHLAACDLDLDGRGDLVVAHATGLLWFRQTHAGRFEATPLATAATTRPRVRCDDIDGDGFRDLFWIQGPGPASTALPNRVFRNLGYGRLIEIAIGARGLGFGDGPLSDVVIADFTGDARQEVWALLAYRPGRLLETGTRLVDRTQAVGLPFVFSELGGLATAADLDGDGDLDAVHMDLRAVHVYENAGETFVTHAPAAVLGDALAGDDAWTDDVDGDGRLDVISAGATGLRVLRQAAPWRFVEDETPGEPGPITVGDLDLDGHAEVFAGRRDDVDRIVAPLRAEGRRSVRLRSYRGAIADVGVAGDRRQRARSTGWVSVPVEATELVVRWSDGAERTVPITAATQLDVDAAPWWSWARSETGRRWARADLLAAGPRALAMWGLVGVLGLVGARRRLPVSGQPAMWAAGALGVVGLEAMLVDVTAVTGWVVAGGAALLAGGAAAVERRWAALVQATRVGPFRLGGQLGSGGMGSVHRAWDPRARRAVALKILRPALVDDRTARARFRREAELGALLDHRNLVKVFEHGEATVYRDDRPQRTAWLAMELVDGTSLRRRLAGPTPPDLTARVLIEVLHGVQALHEAGIVHRDLKPDNVLIGDDGSVKLADFGLARAKAGDALTQTGALLGTLAYMAPELARGGAEPSEVTDLYAVGVLGYALLTGKAPHSGDDTIEVLFRVLHEPIPALSTLGIDVDPALAEVLERAVAAEPARRWASAVAMAEALGPHAAAAVDATRFGSATDDAPAPETAMHTP